MTLTRKPPRPDPDFAVQQSEVRSVEVKISEASFVTSDDGAVTVRLHGVTLKEPDVDAFRLWVESMDLREEEADEVFEMAATFGLARILARRTRRVA